jgi:hypothetical protein
MRKSLAAVAIAFTLPAGVALAQPQNIVPPAQQQALQPGQQQDATKQSSFQAFRANVNPEMVVPTTGPYDESDAFTGPRGYPLEGWSQIKLPNED